MVSGAECGEMPYCLVLVVVVVWWWCLEGHGTLPRAVHEFPGMTVWHSWRGGRVRGGVGGLSVWWCWWWWRGRIEWMGACRQLWWWWTEACGWEGGAAVEA